MILFTKINAQLILQGKKTQTRRFWKSSRCKVGAEHWAQLNLKPESRFARLRILKVWIWDGTTISDEDVEKEGYPDKFSFLNAYYELNDGCLDTKRQHYAVEFELIEEVHNPEIHANDEDVPMEFCVSCEKTTQHYKPSPYDDMFYVDGRWIPSDGVLLCSICS